MIAWYNIRDEKSLKRTKLGGLSVKNIVGAFAFLLGLGLGMIGGAALLAYAYQAAGLYPPDDATIKFIARERGWLRDDV
jgi:hypothetical protein